MQLSRHRRCNKKAFWWQWRWLWRHPQVSLQELGTHTIVTIVKHATYNDAPRNDCKRE